MKWPWSKKKNDIRSPHHLDHVYTDHDVQIGDAKVIGPGDSGYEMLMRAMDSPGTVIMGNRNDDGTWDIKEV